MASVLARCFLSVLLVALIVMCSFTPTRAFSTGMAASLVLGHKSFNWGGAVTSPANQTGFHSPFGVSFDAAGNLWVADLSNNRVLMFKPPFATGMAASLVIGQSDFTSNGQDTTLTTFHGPACLVFDASGNLWVSDYYNNRVLMFKPPFTNGMQASLVLGQTDFTSSGSAVSQTGLNAPEGLGFDTSGNLWVADRGNSRVLMFKPPFSNGMAASLVIGHKSFNWGGTALNQTGFHSPFGVSFDAAGNLWVADVYNSRVLMFRPPFSNGMPASLVIGQADYTRITCCSATKTGVGEPNGLGFDSSGDLWVSDFHNNRVLMFKPPFSNNMPASLVIGQTDFISGSADGGSGTPTQTGLHYPESLVFDAIGNLWVADMGNNRVLMFPGSSGLTGFVLQLQAGWNLMSLPVVPTQTAPAQLLKPLIQLNVLVMVWGYSPTPKPAWSFFAPPNLGTLKNMVDGQGYWVDVRYAVNITIVGYIFAPPPATPPSYFLATGWNLVGFKPEPTITDETVADYLSSITGEYDQNNVWAYNNTSTSWIRADSPYLLQPGQAMWVLMTAPAILRP